MLVISKDQFSGTTAELQARVDAFVAALAAHRLTIGVPAPREDNLVEELARSGELFDVVEKAEELPPVLTLAETRAFALAAIDTKAGEVRKRYITSVPGQEGTYLIKERQAEAFKTALYLGTPPRMVKAEMVATGMTAQAACDYILAARDLWLAKGGDIEEARRVGNVAVEAAVGEAAILAARDAALVNLNVL